MKLDEIAQWGSSVEEKLEAAHVESTRDKRWLEEKAKEEEACSCRRGADRFRKEDAV